MALVLPGSSTVVRSVGDVVHWSLSTVAFAVTLPTRLEALLFSVERLVARINQIADYRAAADDATAHVRTYHLEPSK